MKLLFLTPGTGSYYCGVCMRDNALAKQLCATGHDAFLLPLYLPLTLEESAASPDAPVFFGGLNVYLQQRFAWFRNAPRWLDRLVDHPAILKMLGRFAGMTQGGDTGAITPTGTGTITPELVSAVTSSQADVDGPIITRRFVWHHMSRRSTMPCNLTNW